MLESGLPAGFSYKPDIISRSEEAVLIARLETLPFKPFEFHGYLGNRRIVSYGHRYDYSKHSLQGSDPLPDWLAPLKRTAAEFLAVSDDTLQQALVTEYAPGAGIGWHRDKPMFEHVVAVSFLSPCVLRFRRSKEKGWFRSKQLVEPRSAYRLSGDAREFWQHSIAPMNRLRYSVTFRNFRV
jgi:alkylated DNA repair dioxygenase AlkB